MIEKSGNEDDSFHNRLLFSSIEKCVAPQSENPKNGNKHQIKKRLDESSLCGKIQNFLGGCSLSITFWFTLLAFVGICLIIIIACFPLSHRLFWFW